MSDVTRMLSQIEQGDPAAAEQLLPLVYDELRKLAAAKLAHEQPEQVLQATALVHEAYLRLVGTGRPVVGQSVGQYEPPTTTDPPIHRPIDSPADRAPTPGFDSHGHFFAAAAEACGGFWSSRLAAAGGSSGEVERAAWSWTRTLPSPRLIPPNYSWSTRHWSDWKHTTQAAQLALHARWHLAHSLVQLGRGAESVPIIDECLQRAASQDVGPALVPGVIDLRLAHFLKARDIAGCRATALMWEQLDRADAAGCFKAAELRAVTASVIRTAEPAKLEAAQAEADEAMNWLRKAVAAGYANAAQLANDPDLDGLRVREDFEKLRASLAGGPAADAATLSKSDLQRGLSLYSEGTRLLSRGEFPGAEASLRECVAIREKYAANSWVTFNAQSFLGEVLTKHKNYAAAEPLLLAAHAGLKQRAAHIPADQKVRRMTQSLQRLIALGQVANRIGGPRRRTGPKVKRTPAGDY